jgi:hypothetical protein
MSYQAYHEHAGLAYQANAAQDYILTGLIAALQAKPGMGPQEDANQPALFRS